MIPLQINVQPSGTEDHHTMVLTLDRVPLTLTAYTNKADGRWYLDFEDADGLAVRGLAMTAGVDLLAPYRHLALPPGPLFVLSDDDPDLDAFRERRARLLYLEVT